VVGEVGYNQLARVLVVKFLYLFEMSSVELATKNEYRSFLENAVGLVALLLFYNFWTNIVNI
jgi:hypothetical protein